MIPKGYVQVLAHDGQQAWLRAVDIAIVHSPKQGARTLLLVDMHWFETKDTPDQVLAKIEVAQ